jgi:hypothetical protein
VGGRAKPDAKITNARAGNGAETTAERRADAEGEHSRERLPVHVPSRPLATAASAIIRTTLLED